MQFPPFLGHFWFSVVTLGSNVRLRFRKSISGHHFQTIGKLASNDFDYHTQAVNSTRRYGPLCGPTSSSCGGLRPSAEAFFALWAKKELIILFWPIFGIFWCPVVTLVTFSSNISNNNQKKKKIQKFQKIQKFKKVKKIQKIQKKSKNSKIKPKKSKQN